MVEHINVQDGGFAVEIATNLSGYGYFNQNQIEINNGTFETLADNGGAIRLAIYDGDFYMIGDVLLNDYNGEIYQNPQTGKAQSSCTMKKIVVENKKVISASGKIKNFKVLATLGNVVDTDDNKIPSEDTNIQNIIKKDSNTSIKLEAQNGVIPDNTTKDVTEITTGDIFDRIKNTLSEIKNFKAFDITLKAKDTNIQPNGKVKISIPIPVGFDVSKLIVYRLDENNTKTEYQVTTANEYATFETDHFSTYILGEKSELSNETQDNVDENIGGTFTGTNNTKLPQTGEETNAFAEWLTIAISLMIFWFVSMLLIDHEKKKMTKK